MMFWLLLPAVAALSLVLTYGLRRYALARSLMDIPNARSSHSVPTPRGGGVAIVVSYLLALPALAAMHVLPQPAAWALLGGGPPLILFGSTFELGWLGAGLAAVYLVWLLNLYNFMDGIDGIASVEAICVCIGGAMLYVLAGQTVLSAAPLLLGAAVAGFLYWNFPPARIFMGDAGSGFLGIVLATLSLQAGWVAPELFWSWLILLGVFVCDATFTLLRRLVRGDKVYEAHRSHAYQYASRQFGRHLPVTLAVGGINLFWLLPIALLVGTGRVDGVLGMLAAYLPLLALAVKFRAGQLEVLEA